MSTDPPTASFRFSIGATFTAEPLKPVIEFWASELHARFDVQFAPYNQLEQALLDPGSVFSTNSTGVNIVLIRIEDFGDEPGRISSNIEHLLGSLRSAAFRAPVILCVCPPSKSFRSHIQDVKAPPGVDSLDYHQIADLYPVAEYEAAGGGRLGHIPYTETYFTALGTALVRRADALTRRPFKAIALDCDNTLWTGVCGEDGPAGVIIDTPRRELQRFMRAQRDAGMLLALASKNNETDVIEVFERHPEMPLRLGDFTARRIDWEAKANGLRSLADELNVGLDTFLLIDDSAKECAEVESAAPEVAAVALPAAPGEIAHFLRHVWAFDHPAPTAEDRSRAAYYEQASRFGAELRRSSSMEQFLAGLELEVRIEPLKDERRARVAQLTQRTNQFNFTTIRRTEAELAWLAGDCFTVEVSDRFGDYGLVGVMVVAPENDALAIDTFLLSCRALGRGVEHRMMAFLAEAAIERGLTGIVARLVPTRQNAPARHFLDSIGPPWGRAMPCPPIYRLPATTMRTLKWKPGAAAEQPPPISNSPVENPRRSPNYARIAVALSTPERIIAEMRRQNRGAVAPPSTDPQATPTERRLAEIWSELLRTPAIAASDNFFDLGGHSLLAVLLLARVHETFGVELTIDNVYSGAMTLAGLARRIDNPQSAEYADLLDEIAAMPDEEVRRLLAENEPGGGRS